MGWRVGWREVRESRSDRKIKKCGSVSLTAPGDEGAGGEGCEAGALAVWWCGGASHRLYGDGATYCGGKIGSRDSTVLWCGLVCWGSAKMCCLTRYTVVCTEARLYRYEKVPTHCYMYIPHITFASSELQYTTL